jgi:hypothetical protein
MRFAKQKAPPVCWVMECGTFNALMKRRTLTMKFNESNKQNHFRKAFMPICACSRVKGRIHNWLDRFFPEYTQVFKDWEGKASLITLSHFPLPQGVIAAGKTSVVTVLFRAARKRLMMPVRCLAPIGRRNCFKWQLSSSTG